MLDGHTKKVKKGSKTKERLIYAAPFHTQLSVLLGRTWRTIWRERVSRRIFNQNEPTRYSSAPLLPRNATLFLRRRA